MTSTTTTRLAEADWTVRAAAHARRAEAWTQPHRARRRAGEAHPVLDFLFTYYSHPPGRLARWHPGAGVMLLGAAAAERHGWRHHTSSPDGGVVLDVEAYLARRGDTVRFVRDLLAATASRPPHLGCFGLHEWAMVYRRPSAAVRHEAWPLRLGPAGTDAVVEAHPLRCTHPDAYRFFAAEAVPRNDRPLRREDQTATDQPGCVHVTMDLYKWAYKLGPAVPGDLLLDCFALACRAREVDMRAAPYDLLDLGYEPIPVETPEGRVRYVAHQRSLAVDAAPLRDRLLDVCERMRPERPVALDRLAWACQVRPAAQLCVPSIEPLVRSTPDAQPEALARRRRLRAGARDAGGAADSTLPPPRRGR